MLDPWVLISIAAAAVQSVRTAMQKSLHGSLPGGFVNFARYAFGAPLAMLAFLAWTGSYGTAAPVSALLVANCAAIGLCQILGTAGLIAAFSTRNVAAAVTFTKTDALQTAVLASLVLGETVSGPGWIAMLVSAAGILILSVSPAAGRKLSVVGALEGAAYGLGAGAMFAISSVLIRTATSSIADVDVLSRSLLVLALTTAAQLVMLGGFLAWTDRAGFLDFFRSWRLCSAIGVTSVASSIGWFTAMTLQNPAYVQALGQIELIFSLAVSRIGFREALSGREIAGILLFAAGIVHLLLSA